MARAYCDDWACPSLWSCSRSFARSEAYWQFDIENAPDTYKGPRNPKFDACDDYRRDVPRAWLAGVFTPQTSASRPTIPPGFKLHIATEHEA